MPSTAVAARKNAYARIAYKYPGNRKDANKRTERQQRLIAAEHARKSRKSTKK